MSSEVKEMKHGSLEKAIRLLHEKLHDAEYVNTLRPDDLVKLLELTFDRCGLPKVSTSELTGKGGKDLPSNPTIKYLFLDSKGSADESDKS